jgi:hypothetical protein
MPLKAMQHFYYTRYRSCLLGNLFRHTFNHIRCALRNEPSFTLGPRIVVRTGQSLHGRGNAAERTYQ